MSTPYCQQPAGQPAPQGAPQMGMPVQPALQGANPYPGAAPYQGYPQAYAVGPYTQLPPRVNKLSVGLGIAGWVIIGLTVLLMWLSILATESDPDPSGKEVIGFYPLLDRKSVV